MHALRTPPYSHILSRTVDFLDDFTAYRTTHYKLFNYSHQILQQPVLLMKYKLVVHIDLFACRAGIVKYATAALSM